jgi:predicted dehydrogenase
MTKKPLRIGLVGYGFMGRTHSNAFAKVNQFFDLPYRPVLQAVCARDAAKVAAFADNGAMARPKPTGASWSSAPISI